MTIYIIAALLPAILDIAFDNKYLGRDISASVRRKKLLPYIVVASMPMFIILGLRGYRVGTDTIQYITHLRRISEMTFYEAWDYSDNEPGLYVLMYLCSRISTDPTFFLCVYALITTFSFIRFVEKNGDGELLTIFFHVTLGSFLFIVTGMRQGLAIAFCLLAVEYSRKRKLLPFLLLMLPAFLTHRSSIMFLIVYFIAHRKLSFSNFFFLALAATVFIAFLDVFQSWFNSALDYNYDIEETGNGGIFLMIVLLMNALSLMLSRQVLEERPDALVLYNVSLIAAVLWIARLFTRTAERPSYYFLPATFAVTAIALKKISDPRKRLILKVLVMLLSVLLLVYRLRSAPSLSPFHFYWE